MIQDCQHYNDCRLPTSLCNSKCEKRYKQLDDGCILLGREDWWIPIDSMEQSLIKDIDKK